MEKYIEKYSTSVLENGTAIIEKTDFSVQRRYRRNSRHSGRKKFSIKFLKSLGKNSSMTIFSEGPFNNEFFWSGT